MKKSFQFYLFLGGLFFTQFALAENPLTKEYKRFFNEQEYAGYWSKNVNISVDEDTVSEEIPIKIKFNLKAVEKVLVLKVPESGYDDEGFYSRECRDDYVFVAGYTIDPTKNVSEISFRMRSRCLGERKRLVVWVRTSNGKYYQGTKTFRAYASHETLYW